MHLLNLSSHTALSFGCFVPENPITDLIKCMKKLLEEFRKIILRVSLLNAKAAH